ncbi:DUF1801 domain-containing protein [Chitinophaga niabensis]|uniref:Uncharacterized conserved protein YdeI, YjbR/CyaY-like superfamily, DUF1801 family n=1 Tax=Chitinophaga niabensis TaxID=536979 RepID=A0A1N6FE42_9BACT|nr:YdeI/OmpD-associated family protein [Chitinophaga niabensis]SIN93573.1 Uncharacterized conserved protein YdeI, YjbR/CyaY-like superfamily, DUF1801 family [Chitinophaga niabensis]
MKKVDDYIARSAPFAQPILEHLRELVYKACPHAEETIKWGMPIFETYGANMCSMAAFKQHCAFGFWKASLLEDKQGILQAAENAMGSLGRITSLEDLPSEKILISYLREADALNRDNIKVPKVPKEKKELVTPRELAAALKKNKAATKVFDAFSYSCKKEYIDWIDEAKTEATKLKRVATAIEWIAEGKDRNWKYKK